MAYFPLRFAAPAIIIVISLIAGLYSFYGQFRAAEHDSIRYNRSYLNLQLDQLQRRLTRLATDGDLGLLHTAISRLSGPDPAFSLVLDQRGNVVASHRWQRLARSLPQPTTDGATPVAAVISQLRSDGSAWHEQPRLWNDGRYVIGVRPIALPGHMQPGAVILGLDMEPSRQAARASAMARARNFGLLLAALAGLVTVMFHFGVTRRMAPILQVVRGLSEGRFDRRTHLRGRDEIAALARAVDRAAERLGRSEARLREAQRIGRLGSWEAVPGSQVIECSPETMRIFGRNPAGTTMTHESFLNLVHPDDLSRVMEQTTDLDRRRIRRARSGRLQYRIRLADGEVRWLESRWRLHLDDHDGRAPRLRGTIQDITEQKRTEQALFETRERALVTLHSIGDAVITTGPDGEIDYLNPVAEALTGWSTREARGRPLHEVFEIISESTGEPAANPVETCLREGRTVGLANHTVLVHRDGRHIAIEDSAAPIRDRNGRLLGVVMVFHDVTRQRELAQRLSWQATHDALTGLCNRAEFERRLHDALDDAHAHDQQHALIYFDLDQFKIVNDSAGHTAGDELLRQIPVILEQAIRGSDMLARLGGDEFALILYRCSMADAQRVAEKLLGCIREFRFVWEDRSFELGASFGVVPINCDSGSAANLLTAADITCYSAKDDGRGRVHTYHLGDAELTRRHSEIQLVSAITRALDEDRFRLYAQPIVPCNDRDGPRMHELLLRMIDENGEELPPDRFIPAAERFDLMPTLDRWVIRNVLRFHDRHLGGDRDAMLCVNLSGTSLSDEGFLHFLYQEIDRCCVPPSAICFEITETAAIANLARTSQFIRALKRLGCRFSLDDFGAGVSSFAYLKNLPVDYLKIDGCFVQDMIEDPIDFALVESINNIGHVLGIRTIAEFVEDAATLGALRELGVDYAQGFGVEMPRPLEQVFAVTAATGEGAGEATCGVGGRGG